MYIWAVAVAVIWHCQLTAATCPSSVPLNCSANCHIVTDLNGCVQCTCESLSLTCQNVTCAHGEYCQLKQVQCIKAPCRPVPQCLALTSTVLPSICYLSPDIGTCHNHSVMRYFYNMTSHTCQLFEYSGCLGNENNFIHLDDCVALCQKTAVSTTVSPRQYCLESPDYGINCGSNQTYWFYNQSSGHCEQFVYGGCLGNQNKFPLREVCQSVCLSTDTVATPQAGCPKMTCSLSCDAGYKTNENGCEICQCVEACQMITCPDQTQCSLVKLNDTSGCVGDICGLNYQLLCLPVTTITTTVTVPPYCLLNPDYGFSCRSNQTNWFYNHTSSQCEQFTYGGCHGNTNNFPLREVCQSVCNPSTTTASQLQSCCQSEGVSDICLPFCSYDVTYSDLLTTSSSALSCLTSLDTIINCITGGVDQTICCANNGVRHNCLGFCSGHVSDMPSNVIQCAQDLDIAISCYKNAATNQPTVSVTARSCPSQQCNLQCGTMGYIQDDQGCDLCACRHPMTTLCPAINCSSLFSCTYGLDRDSAGCTVCSCYNPCHNVVCNETQECLVNVGIHCIEDDICSPTYTPYCSSKCEVLSCNTSNCQYGRILDPTTHCDTCQCLQPCHNVTCTNHSSCQVVTETSCIQTKCQTVYRAQCVENCPDIECDQQCQYGQIKDLNGCETCHCYDPCQNVSCASGQKCQPSSVPVWSSDGDKMQQLYLPECVDISSTTVVMSSTSTYICPQVLCDIAECSYGLATDSRGCDICECYDPCKNVQCSNGWTCVPSSVPILVGVGSVIKRVYVANCFLDNISSSPSGLPSPSTTRSPECSPVSCLMACQFGFESDPITGCNICVCHNPCNSILCSVGSICQVSVHADSYVTSCISVTNSVMSSATTSTTGAVTSSAMSTISATKTTTNSCKPVMCRMFCEFGWDKDPLTGCEICSCFDPCKGVVCQPGSSCYMTSNGLSACISTSTSFSTTPRSRQAVISGIAKVDADFLIIVSRDDFILQMTKQIANYLHINENDIEITDLQPGSIDSYFIITDNVNVTAVLHTLSHWTNGIIISYNGAFYTATLVKYYPNDVTTAPSDTRLEVLLMAILIPVIGTIIIILIILTVVLVYRKVRKSHGNPLTGTTSRESSVFGGEIPVKEHMKLGFDNPYYVHSVSDKQVIGNIYSEA